MNHKQKIAATCFVWIEITKTVIYALLKQPHELNEMMFTHRRTNSDLAQHQLISRSLCGLNMIC